MLWYAVGEIAVILPLSVIYFRAPPEQILPSPSSGSDAGKARVLGWPPNLVFRRDVWGGGVVLRPDGDATGPFGRVL